MLQYFHNWLLPPARCRPLSSYFTSTQHHCVNHTRRWSSTRHVGLGCLTQHPASDSAPWCNGMQAVMQSSSCTRLQHLTDAALAAAEVGDFNTAAAQFGQALQLGAKDAALHEQRAQCLMELEQYDDALLAAETATTLQPEWCDGWVTLGRCYLNTGQLQSAQQAFSRSLALNPDKPETQQELSEVVALAQQQLARQIGLPGLAISADPARQLGLGCVIWEAGIQLAKLLVKSSHGPHHNHTQQQQQQCAAQPCTMIGRCLAGAHVLEVGSGTGICGITAAALGAQVTLTDLPELQSLLAANIAANEGLIAAAGGSATAAVLDWDQQNLAGLEGTAGDDNENSTGAGSSTGSSSGNSAMTVQHSSGVLDLTCQHWDWAMGADLVFNASQVQPVVQLIASIVQDRSHTGSGAPAAAVAAGGPLAGFLLAHKHRHQQLDEQLQQALLQAGLELQVLQDDSAVGISWITRDVASSCAGSASLSSSLAVQQQQEQQQLQQNRQQQQRQDEQEPLQKGGRTPADRHCCQGTNQQQHTVGNNLQQQQQQREGERKQPQLHKKLLLLSAGLAGVGKSTVLKLLTARLGSCCVYIDKDTINAALLGGRPYFSDYYRRHVQQQTYAVMFGIAADNLAAQQDCVVILDGQFGDKLTAGYIWPYVQRIRSGEAVEFASGTSSSQCEHPSQSALQCIQRHDSTSSSQEALEQQRMPECGQDMKHGAVQGQRAGAKNKQGAVCLVVLLLFDTEGCGNVQLQRLRTRGLPRDEGKYASFEQYRLQELELLQQQLVKAGGQLDGVVRIDTCKDPAHCVDDICFQLGALSMP